MKKINIFYWIITGLFAAFMLMSAIQNIMVTPESVDLMTTQLGYPKYFIPFIGVAKLLGSIAIIIPGFPRIKEWAYAGLFFDLFSATYSSIAAAGFKPEMLFMLIFFAFWGASYFLYHKRLSHSSSL